MSTTQKNYGETWQHKHAKMFFYNFFKKLGYDPILEYSVAPDQRADLFLVGQKSDIKIVFEFQNSNISLKEIHRRTDLYIQRNIVVIWIPFLNLPTEGGVIEKYAPLLFERWVHGFNGGKILYFNPHKDCLYIGQFSTCKLPRENQYGEKYDWFSRRYKKFEFREIDIENIKWGIKKRNQYVSKNSKYVYPRGLIIDFTRIDSRID